MNEFSDVMPHKISVVAYEGVNDYGKPKYGSTERTYSCLLDDSNTVRRNVDGVQLVEGLVAYVFAIPDGETEPRSISALDKVSVTVPENFGDVGPISSIGRHWWIDGSLHNMEVKWA